MIDLLERTPASATVGGCVGENRPRIVIIFFRPLAWTRRCRRKSLVCLNAWSGGDLERLTSVVYVELKHFTDWTQ